jgi:hypothetical protein
MKYLELEEHNVTCQYQLPIEIVHANRHVRQS